jgi:HEPN domain-containing protein
MNEKTIKNWISLSDYDIKTAKAMLDSGRYLYVTFTCQQAVEKILKAIFVQNEGKTPPYIHNLTTLSSLLFSEDELTKDQEEFIAVLNAFYLKTRYSEQILTLSQDIDRLKAETIFQKTNELLSWLKSRLK